MPRRTIQDPRLTQVVNRLVEGLHPHAIILFGGRARGTNRVESDYDLLVVSERVLDYDEVYRPVSGRGLRCDIVPCTVDACEKPIWMPAACFETRLMTALSCMANRRRVAALLEMADEDLAGASALLDISTRLA